MTDYTSLTILPLYILHVPFTHTFVHVQKILLEKLYRDC